MGADGIHPRVVRELVEKLINPLFSIYQQFWIIKEIPGDWRLVSVTTHLQEGREESGELQPCQPNLGAREQIILEQIILSAITHHIQDNQGSGPPGMVYERQVLPEHLDFLL